MRSGQLAIATLNEGPLHAGLKDWFARPGDRAEVPVDGRQIDLVRGDLLIEIQTGSFSALRTKLELLLEEHSVHVVHPIAFEKWILRVEGDEQRKLGRRKSPARGRVEDAFQELVSLAKIIAHPRFSFEIVLTQEEEVRRHEAGRVWRRKGWVIVERRLLDVVESHHFAEALDLLRLLPPDLPASFTTADIAATLDVSRDLAQKMAYCLREAGVILAVGKQGNARTYRISPGR